MSRPLGWAARAAALVASAALLAGTAAAAGGPLAVEEIASGVYVHRGVQAETAPRNRGDIANVGFIVGERCVAVIDTGGSPAVGRALRDAVRAVTAIPVCYVINTHAHPDHIFGNAVFQSAGVEFVGHAKLAAAMNARARNYLAALHRVLGEAADGASVVPPSRVVSDSATLDLGGRTLTLVAWPTAHTDHDLTVLDERTRTLWLGDLLFIEHVPVVDGSLPGWIEVLARLKRIAALRVVPGHGAVSSNWPAVTTNQERYLDRLITETRAALRGRLTIREAVDVVGVAERGRWLLFDAFHRRNVTAAYAELEWE